MKSKIEEEGKERWNDRTNGIGAGDRKCITQFGVCVYVCVPLNRQIEF